VPMDVDAGRQLARAEGIGVSTYPEPGGARWFRLPAPQRGWRSGTDDGTALRPALRVDSTCVAGRQRSEHHQDAGVGRIRAGANRQGIVEGADRALDRRASRPVIVGMRRQP
jgi:hypothetical protein